MILSFLAPSTRYPIGGNAMIYEFATALAQRGHDVHLYHHDLFGDDALSSLDEIDWYTFRADLTHHFMGPGPADSAKVGSADIFFGYSQAVEDNPRFGLPVSWIQGYKMYPDDREVENFHRPCPKICIAQWLVDVAIDHGVPADQLIHISNALNHDHHRLTRPIEGRPARVLFCYNAHAMKGAPLAVEVLERLHARRPDVEIVGFGSRAPEVPLPEWITYHESPAQHVLVDELYNGSAIFLWTSEIEGFGLPALESMACGAALVTTDNGGSQDFARHEETALVAAYPNGHMLLAHLERLLDDETERVRLARAGRALTLAFTWERAGRLLEEFLERYLADPVRYGRPPAAGTAPDRPDTAGAHREAGDSNDPSRTV